MSDNSIYGDDAPQERSSFEQRMAAFFSGEPLPPQVENDLDIGASKEQIRQREEAELEANMDALNDLDNLDSETLPAVIKTCFIAAYQQGDELPEKVYDDPDPACRYGKAFARVRALEAELEGSAPDDRPRIEADLQEANSLFELEKERALNDRFRGFHLIDKWRAGEGREVYKRSRRKTRNAPNESLKDMTDEERAAHRRAQKADSKYRKAKVALGWTAEEIEAGLDALRVKRSKRT